MYDVGLRNDMTKKNKLCPFSVNIIERKKLDHLQPVMKNGASKDAKLSILYYYCLLVKTTTLVSCIEQYICLRDLNMLLAFSLFQILSCSLCKLHAIPLQICPTRANFIFLNAQAHIERFSKLHIPPVSRFYVFRSQFSIH